MRVIDLLNKIANDEEVPKEIYYRCSKYTYDDYMADYKRDMGTDLFTNLFSKERTNCFINDEVEIIEEDKKIEKLNKIHFHKKQRQLANKINEIIDYINGSDKE